MATCKRRVLFGTHETEVMAKQERDGGGIKPLVSSPVSPGHGGFVKACPYSCDRTTVGPRV